MAAIAMGGLAILGLAAIAIVLKQRQPKPAAGAPKGDDGGNPQQVQHLVANPSFDAGMLGLDVDGYVIDDSYVHSSSSSSSKKNTVRGSSGGGGEDANTYLAPGELAFSASQSTVSTPATIYATPVDGDDEGNEGHSSSAVAAAAAKSQQPPAVSRGSRARASVYNGFAEDEEV